MIDQMLLQTIGISSEDAFYLSEQNKIWETSIQPLAEEYAKTLGHRPFLPYDSPEQREEAHTKGKEYALEVISLNPDQPYLMRLLAWLHQIPYLKRRYEELGLEESMMISLLQDLSYKVQSCKKIFGVCGVSVDWFFLHFEVKLFSMGRLQYEINRFPHSEYVFGEFEIRQGDPVYSCHIPASGKLHLPLCMDSLHQAYEFFKTDLKGSVLPVLCQSWLLYEPYAEHVFPEGSNLQGFARMFDVYANTDTEKFHDCPSIFGKSYEGTTDGLPCDTTLRRNFVDYIQKGGSFGIGRGMLLYDGEQRRILNQK